MDKLGGWTMMRRIRKDEKKRKEERGKRRELKKMEIEFFSNC